MKSLRLRFAAHLTTLVTVAAVGATLAAPAEAAGTPGPAGKAAHWLGRQINAQGVVHNAQYDYDDYGLTIDTAVGILAAQGRTAKVVAARRAVAHHLSDYTTGAAFGSSDVYAGPTAKAALFAQLTGARARHFGGVNLVHRLAGMISSAGPTVGRLEDRTSGTDYANTLGQAYAVRALATAHSAKSRPALRFLLEQQCAAGWFRLTFSAKTGPQSCAKAPAATKVPDTDATSVALIQLQALPHQSKTVVRAERRALRWLTRHQHANGSFGGGTSTSASNSNSTGLAAAALAGGGRCRPAARAARWVGRLQVTRYSGAALSREIGAVAYDAAALRAGQQAGIDTPSRDQWRRATAQAVLGLAAAASCR